jgi:autotransporter-associated beta strand protein
MTMSGSNAVMSSSNGTGGVGTTDVWATLSGSGALTAVGNGLLVLAGSNSAWTGPLAVNSGTVQVGSATGLGNGGLIANGGTLDLAGYSPTIASLAGLAGTITNSGTAKSLLSINESGTTSFGGSIIDGNTNKVALALTGGGTLTLSGTNTYTGGTTVSNGELILTNNEAIADGTSLTVGNSLAFAAPVLPAAVVAGPTVVAGLQTVPQPAIAPVPEPSTPALVVAGAIAAIGIWRRKGRKA